MRRLRHRTFYIWNLSDLSADRAMLTEAFLEKALKLLLLLRPRSLGTNNSHKTMLNNAYAI